MIFITTYRIKQQSRDETKKLMGIFAEKGVPSTGKATMWPPTAARAW